MKNSLFIMGRVLCRPPISAGDRAPALYRAKHFVSVRFPNLTRSIGSSGQGHDNHRKGRDED